jgi:fructose-bisphosphate aldolase, class II
MKGGIIMPLVTTKNMFEKAFKGGYAIGAFNINNMEIVQGVVDGAKVHNSSVILQVSSGAMKYMRPKYLLKLVEAASEETGLDIALHLDHGADFETCKKAIECGFTSVMIDGSHHPLEENIKVTKEVVEYAHARGVVVEAELGKLAGVEDEVKVASHEATYTDPDEAIEFVKRTGVDSLAIAIGTSHGAYKFKGEAKLDFDRLETITNKLEEAGINNFPIVLHGASAVEPEFVQMCNNFGGEMGGAKGVPAEMLRKASSMSVCKINMDTDLRLAMTGSVRKVLTEDPKQFDPRKYLGLGRENIEKLVEKKITDVLGSKDSNK